MERNIIHPLVEDCPPARIFFSIFMELIIGIEPFHHISVAGGFGHEEIMEAIFQDTFDRG